MNVFISQPMRGKTEEEILREREKGKQLAKSIYGDVEIIDSYISINPTARNQALWMLGDSLMMLATADAALFLDGWQDARGCKIEHTCCLEYGIDTSYENGSAMSEQENICDVLEVTK